MNKAAMQAGRVRQLERKAADEREQVRAYLAWCREEAVAQARLATLRAELGPYDELVTSAHSELGDIYRRMPPVPADSSPAWNMR